MHRPLERFLEEGFISPAPMVVLDNRLEFLRRRPYCVDLCSAGWELLRPTRPFPKSHLIGGDDDVFPGDSDAARCADLPDDDDDEEFVTPGETHSAHSPRDIDAMNRLSNVSMMPEQWRENPVGEAEYRYYLVDLLRQLQWCVLRR